jgi:hypothetical protein
MAFMRLSKPWRSLSIIFGGGLAFLLVWLTWGDLTKADKDLTDRILAGRGTAVRVGDIYPGEWDYVCYIDNYSFSSSSLEKRLPVVVADLRFSPSDRWVDEERWGLAFVTRRTAQARIFLVDNQAIYRIEGPECVTRETGTFNVDTVEALNLTYTRLTIAGSR